MATPDYNTTLDVSPAAAEWELGVANRFADTSLSVYPRARSVRCASWTSAMAQPRRHTQTDVCALRPRAHAGEP